jgi:hypothetical protein
MAEKWFLTMQFKRLGAFSLLIFASAATLAEPAGHRRDARETIRAYHVQSVALDRGNRPDQPPSQQPMESRRGREIGAPDSSGYGAPLEGQASAPSDNNRRQGRLSPEERRALRRQIDEVGHDIYAPKR